jgi:ribosomal protein S12 methylthiotransferase
VSRPAADVLREAERLVQAGVKELLVISQDTSAYGSDLKYAVSNWRGRELRAKLIDLASALGEFGVWVRLHYVYPYPHVDEVIPLMAERKILPYLDIPFQHASPDVLKRMRRPAAQEKTLQRITRWRAICPELTLRSTFIVGFPGETDRDFELLLQWLEEAALDRVGCFRYEPVAGATANGAAAAIPDEVKEERWYRFMQAQQKISARRLKRKVGTRQQVIIDKIGPDSFVGARPGAKPVPTFASRALAKGRSMADAPEIDGAVYVASRRPLRVGEYDLHGTAVGF